MNPERSGRVDALAAAESVGVAENAAAGLHASRVEYDAEVRLHNEILRRSYDIRSHDHVLDIGCGAGQSTRDAARLATAGSVLGVDVSAIMIERARRLTDAAGLHNVTFERADAQIHDFGSERFDDMISRFGTRVFADPIAAFTNVGRAMQHKGRLVMMVWRDHHLNEWSMSIQRAISDSAGTTAGSVRTPDPFSLADPSTTAGVLEATGFGDATFIDVHEPVYYGPDVDAALEWVSGFSCVKVVLQALDSVSTARTREQLRQMLAAHASNDGVWLDSRAWIVSALRR